MDIMRRAVILVLFLGVLPFAESIDCVRLINAVRNRPNLWDTREASGASTLAWTEVATELQEDVSTVYATWNLLRWTFICEYGTSMNCYWNSQHCQQSQWVHYNDLRFLIPQLTYNDYTRSQQARLTPCPCVLQRERINRGLNLTQQGAVERPQFQNPLGPTTMPANSRTNVARGDIYHGNPVFPTPWRNSPQQRVPGQGSCLMYPCTQHGENQADTLEPQLESSINMYGDTRQSTQNVSTSHDRPQSVRYADNTTSSCLVQISPEANEGLYGQHTSSHQVSSSPEVRRVEQSIGTTTESTNSPISSTSRTEANQEFTIVIDPINKLTQIAEEDETQFPDYDCINFDLPPQDVLDNGPVRSTPEHMPQTSQASIHDKVQNKKKTQKEKNKYSETYNELVGVLVTSDPVKYMLKEIHLLNNSFNRPSRSYVQENIKKETNQSGINSSEPNSENITGAENSNNSSMRSSLQLISANYESSNSEFEIVSAEPIDIETEGRNSSQNVPNSGFDMNNDHFGYCIITAKQTNGTNNTCSSSTSNESCKKHKPLSEETDVPNKRSRSSSDSNTGKTDVLENSTLLTEVSDQENFTDIVFDEVGLKTPVEVDVLNQDQVNPKETLSEDLPEENGSIAIEIAESLLRSADNEIQSSSIPIETVNEEASLPQNYSNHSRPTPSPSRSETPIQEQSIKSFVQTRKSETVKYVTIPQGSNQNDLLKKIMEQFPRSEEEEILNIPESVLNQNELFQQSESQNTTGSSTPNSEPLPTCSRFKIKKIRTEQICISLNGSDSENCGQEPPPTYEEAVSTTPEHSTPQTDDSQPINLTNSEVASSNSEMVTQPKEPERSVAKPEENIPDEGFVEGSQEDNANKVTGKGSQNGACPKKLKRKKRVTEQTGSMNNARTVFIINPGDLPVSGTLSYLTNTVNPSGSHQNLHPSRFQSDILPPNVVPNAIPPNSSRTQQNQSGPRIPCVPTINPTISQPENSRNVPFNHVNPNNRQHASNTPRQYEVIDRLSALPYPLLEFLSIPFDCSTLCSNYGHCRNIPRSNTTAQLEQNLSNINIAGSQQQNVNRNYVSNTANQNPNLSYRPRTYSTMHNPQPNPRIENQQFINTPNQPNPNYRINPSCVQTPANSTQTTRSINCQCCRPPNCGCRPTNPQTVRPSNPEYVANYENHRSLNCPSQRPLNFANPVTCGVQYFPPETIHITNYPCRSYAALGCLGTLNVGTQGCANFDIPRCNPRNVTIPDGLYLRRESRDLGSENPTFGNMRQTNPHVLRPDVTANRGSRNIEVPTSETRRQYSNQSVRPVRTSTGADTLGTANLSTVTMLRTERPRRRRTDSNVDSRDPRRPFTPDSTVENVRPVTSQPGARVDFDCTVGSNEQNRRNRNENPYVTTSCTVVTRPSQVTTNTGSFYYRVIPRRSHPPNITSTVPRTQQGTQNVRIQGSAYPQGHNDPSFATVTTTSHVRPLFSVLETTQRNSGHHTNREPNNNGNNDPRFYYIPPTTTDNSN